MKKYIVTGYTKVSIEVTVEAKNKKEAIKKAYENVLDLWVLSAMADMTN